MASAIPLYAGIERLAARGDHLQWGGPVLYADGRFATGEGKARFSPVEWPRRPAAAGAALRLSTRRGKQFNSMIHRRVDPLTGAHRDEALVNAEDAARLGVQTGDQIRLRSPHGVLSGQVRVAPIKAGNVEVHWPEGNVLLSGAAVDPDSHEPDYNTLVTIERIGSDHVAKESFE
jgi:anaerobic selenocysteine-containing dehydrogenase